MPLPCTANGVETSGFFGVQDILWNLEMHFFKWIFQLVYSLNTSIINLSVIQYSCRCVSDPTVLETILYHYWSKWSYLCQVCLGACHTMPYSLITCKNTFPVPLTAKSKSWRWNPQVPRLSMEVLPRLLKAPMNLDIIKSKVSNDSSRKLIGIACNYASITLALEDTCILRSVLQNLRALCSEHLNIGTLICGHDAPTIEPSTHFSLGKYLYNQKSPVSNFLAWCRLVWFILYKCYWCYWPQPHRVPLTWHQWPYQPPFRTINVPYIVFSLWSTYHQIPRRILAGIN